MNRNNQWEWEWNGNKTRLNLGLGMGMGINHWEWEGMGLKKIFSLISASNRTQASQLKWRMIGATSGGLKLQCIAIATLSSFFLDFHISLKLFARIAVVLSCRSDILRTFSFSQFLISHDSLEVYSSPKRSF